MVRTQCPARKNHNLKTTTHKILDSAHIFKRNVNKLEFVPDFSKNLDYSCFWKNDTHINYKGAKILTFNLLNYIDNSFNEEIFEKLINKCNLVETEEPCDLLSGMNWSYSVNEKVKIELGTYKYEIPKRIKEKSIPEKFSTNNARLSMYFENPDSFTNSRALIFGASSNNFLKYYLSLYFRETFFYWDHLDVTKQVIDWYKPDFILEIRVERFLESHFNPVWIKNFLKNFKPRFK